MEKRAFGRTGLQVPLLGFGAQRIVDEHRCGEDEAVAIVHAAIDCGVTYFDTAPSYSAGQSETRLGKALAMGGRRGKVHIATKTHDRTRDGSLRLLEESLKRLQTDCVEEWRLHNIATMDELERCFAKGGAMEALLEAKEQGIVKYLSISGHTNPRVQLEAIERFPFDSALVAISAPDAFIYSFEHEFLPEAVRKGVAVIGMKVLALGRLGARYEQALRYTWSLPVSTTIVGMETMEQLQRNLDAAERFSPLSDIERLTLLKEAAPLAEPDVLRWKRISWDSGGWAERTK